MNKRKHRKLELSTRTIRSLQGNDLARVGGGTQLVTLDDPATRASYIATCEDCLKTR
jgi:hypothetical protein